MMKQKCDRGMRACRLCARETCWLYAPTVSLNNTSSTWCGANEVPCYFWHSSVVSFLWAPHTLNSHCILKLCHSESSYILTSLAHGRLHYQGAGTRKLWVLSLFSSRSRGEFVWKVPSSLLSETEWVLTSCKTIHYVCHCIITAPQILAYFCISDALMGWNSTWIC
jgi:hypothetical protein